MSDKAHFKPELKALKYALAHYPAVLEKVEMYEKEIKSWYGEDKTRHYTAFFFHLLQVVAENKYSDSFDRLMTDSNVLFFARLMHSGGVSLCNMREGTGYWDYIRGNFNDVTERLILSFPE